MNSMYKELTDKAFHYHKMGDLGTAAHIYRKLLEVDPEDANVLNLLGMLTTQLGKTDEAIDLLSKALIILQSASIAGNLGKAYHTAGMLDKAIKLYHEALKLEADENTEKDDIYFSLGLAYKQSGDNPSAAEYYKKALEENPGNYSACYNLAITLSDLGDTAQALFYAKKCEILKDNDDSLFGFLSSLYEKIEDYEAAVQALEKAVKINPDNFLYFYNAAVLNSYLNKDDKALYCYLKAVSINPEHIESYVNLANIIKKQDNEKAVEYLLKAYEINPKEEKLLLSLAQSYKDIYKNNESLKILNELLNNNPNCAEAYSLAAMNYMDICRYENALENYDKAVNLEPENLNFRHGRAVCLKYLGRIDECREILENIVNNEDAPLETKITLGMLYLQNKEFKRGMNLYRLRVSDIKSAEIQKDKIWEPGSSIENKTVLVYSNCGLGDSIMYSRYLPFLKEKAKNVILQIDDTLETVMQESFPMITAVKKSVKPPEHDIVLQFMDIQYALDMDFSNIPSANGYLQANEDLIKMFAKLPVFKSGKKKIGLFWQGNRRIFKNRAVPFEIIKQLTENKNYNFYSFQKDVKIEETGNFFDLSEHIKDYADTAALLKNTDLLITIDSSIAHMAGALGVKTYLLLPKTAEWRWFDDDKKTPWYSSITIFKQKTSADRHEAVERIKNHLQSQQKMFIKDEKSLF